MSVNIIGKMHIYYCSASERINNFVVLIETPARLFLVYVNGAYFIHSVVYNICYNNTILTCFI